tara:strand:- start:852 stop:1556 length:705 start_codon:yes stop_codon:yes gene_type:complete
MTHPIEVNERVYPGIPSTTAIVICLDGSQKEYFEQASKLNLIPNIDALKKNGEDLLVNSAIPSFTNPNNISIVTGRPSSVHGICGNFFFTPSTGEEVMMNDPKFLRAPTIFQKFYEQGAKIAIVTAKDKLRKLLSHGLKFNDSRAICFSSEKSDQATKNENGIDNINNWLGMKVPMFIRKIYLSLLWLPVSKFYLSLNLILCIYLQQILFNTNMHQVMKKQIIFMQCLINILVN